MIKPIAIGLIIGFLIGFNVGNNANKYKNVWDQNRQGMKILNNMMKDDKTTRLALVAITEKQIYAVQSIHEQKYRAFGGIVDEEQKKVVISSL